MTNRDRDLIDCFFYLNSNYLDLEQIISKLKDFSQIKRYILARFINILKSISDRPRFPNILLKQQNIITNYAFSNQDIRNLLKMIKELIACGRE